MCPSAFSILGPQARGDEVGGGQTCTKTFLGQVGICVQNFIMIDAGIWISMSPPHTNRQTNKHLYTHFYIITYLLKIKHPIKNSRSHMIERILDINLSGIQY